MTRYRWILAGLLVACGGDGAGGNKSGEPEICENGGDDDGDGLTDCLDPDCFSANCVEDCADAADNDLDGLVDCDDPGCDGQCPEACDDHRDNDGDGATDCLDPDCDAVCDTDGDGFLDIENGGDDCDDENPDAYPGAIEVCDGADNDCNGLVDMDDPGLDRTTLTRWYLDDDGDGAGDPDTMVPGCDPIAGYVDLGGDCDDADPALNLDDLDADGQTTCDGDCDDADGSVYAGAPDPLGDGIDQSCDGEDGIRLFDDFELGTPSPLVWTSVTGDQAIDTTYVGNGSYALNMGGGIAVATTVAVDTTPCTEVRVSWLGKRGPESPDPGESVTFDYLSAAGWVFAAAWEGQTVTDAVFSPQVVGITDPGAFWSAFQLRLTTNGSGAGTDDFYLDDFEVRCVVDVDLDGFEAWEDCDDTDPAHWSDCGLCVDPDGDDRGVGCDLGGDCAEGDPAVYTGAPDPWGDGRDTNCDGGDGPYLFDDFELGTADPAVFAAIAGDAAVQGAEVYAGAWALELLGTGSAETVTIDTTTCPSVAVAFVGRRVAPAPAAGVLLKLEYWDGAAWQFGRSWRGDGTVDPGYWSWSADLAAAGALHPDLRVRLTDGGTTAGLDAFVIDDFLVTCSTGDADGDGAPDLGDCDAADPDHWSDCALCVDVDGDGAGMWCDPGIDCDETDPGIHTGAADPVGDGIDQNCDGVDGSALFDDFELGVPDPVVWLSVTGDAVIDTAYVASGVYALRLGGGVGVAETVPFDARACTSVILVDWLGKKGPETPDNGDGVTIDYLTPAGWVFGYEWAGVGATDATFSPVGFQVNDAAARWSGFQLRLTSHGSGTNFDEFYFDDFSLRCLSDADGDGVETLLDCDDDDPNHWSDCGLCVDVDGDQRGAYCDLGIDCDEGDPAIHAGAFDPLGDGIDQDCDGQDGSGLFDDFELGLPDPAVWMSVTGDGGIDATYAASGLYSLNLGGGAATAETMSTNTSGCATGVEITWMGKRGPETPDATDGVTFDFFDGVGWVFAYEWAGAGVTDATFLPQAVQITAAAARHPAFRLRLTSHGSGVGFDDYFVDDFDIHCF